MSQPQKRNEPRKRTGSMPAGRDVRRRKQSASRQVREQEPQRQRPAKQSGAQTKQRPAKQKTAQTKHVRAPKRSAKFTLPDRRTLFAILGALLLIAAIVLLVVGIKSCGNKENKEGRDSAVVSSLDNSSLVTGKPAKATILSSGDYLIHKEIFTNISTGNGTWDFDSIFTNVKDEISAADYAICNFEFTITEGTNYNFYPHFKLPPASADALKNAGFDFLITANNHSGDDREEGIYRTVKILRDKGFKTTGTKATPDEKSYAVVNVKGIKIGIVNYTFGTIDDQGLKALNGNAALDANASQCINVFQNEKLDQLYTELDQITKAMKKDGAEAYIAYMHWGNEFQLTQSTVQEEIAQKLCDLGYAAVIGGHPHVIQPAAVLKDANGNKTFCLYSMGNMVSNQRREYFPSSRGYTEDAIFVYTTFERDNDGNVKLTNVDYTPVWMNKYSSGGRYAYRLEACKGENLSSSQQASKDRTDGLVKAGFDAFETQ